MAIVPLLRGEAEDQGLMGGRQGDALGVATERVAGEGDDAVGDGAVGDGAAGCISTAGCVAGEGNGAAGEGAVGFMSSGSGPRVRVHVYPFCRALTKPSCTVEPGKHEHTHERLAEHGSMQRRRHTQTLGRVIRAPGG